MFKITTPIALAAVLALGGLTAQAEGVELTDAAKERIRTDLTAQGYDVGKIKTEDGLYEAYAKKDGQKLEIFLDEDFEIVRTETED